MEGLSPLHRRVAGIDVHRMLLVVTVLIEQPDGSFEWVYPGNGGGNGNNSNGSEGPGGHSSGGI